jgi:flagellar M-ring protein FliF
VLQRARDWWETQSRTNQIIFAASAVGVFVALVGFVFWAGQPEYTVLFGDMEAEQASKVSDKLREQNVPFKLTGGGRNIEVPVAKRDELRMQLLGQGVIQSGNANLGYEVIDGISPMATESVERTKLLMAREGEVSKTIMSMEQVATATVKYSEADTSLFAAGKKEASAAVIVGLKPGMSLSKENIKAIVRLTQMPLTGLQERGITVSDTQGNLLWDGPAGGDNNTGDFMEQTRAYANERRTELQSVLDRALGKGNSVVLVNPEMNFDSETVKRVVPEAGIPISKTSEVETFEGKGSLGRNAVGTTANAAGAPNPAAPGAAPTTPPTYMSSNSGDGKYNHENTITNYAAGQTETTTTKAPMRIEKLTVSAMIDSNIKLADGKPIDVAGIKQILENHIAAAANDTARSVSVVLFPFNHSEELEADKAAAAAAAAERMQRTLAIAVPLVLMLVCFFLLARALKKPGILLPPGGEQLALAGAGVGSFGALEAGQGFSTVNAPEGTMIVLPDGTTANASEYVVSADGTLMRRATDDEGDPIGLLVGETEPKTYDVIQQQFDGVLESILHMARSKPEMVGALIKTWVSEEM